MTTLTPQDEEHLRLLAIFHYVVAGITALFSLIPIAHITVGILMVMGKLESGPSDAAEPLWMGWMFIAMGGVWMAAGLTLAVCLALAGRYLRARQHYMYCLVVACIACIFTPFGTVLGIFTIIVLMRQTVKDAFAATAA